MSNPEDNTMVSALMYKYLPYWPLFVLLIALSTLAAWGYLHFFAVPSYEVSASLIIKDENKGVNDAKMTESIDAFTSNKIVENEIKVLYSRTLLQHVVNKLRLYAPIFEEGKFKTTSAYTTSPIVVKLRKPEELREYEKVYFRYNGSQKKVIIDNKAYPINKWVKTPFGEIQFTENKNRIEHAVEPLYFSIIKPKKVVNQLLSNISIQASSKVSTIIDLKLKDEVPQRGENILDYLIKSYNEVEVKERIGLASNTLEFVENRIQLVEKELEDLENKLVQYKSTKGGVNLSEQGKLVLESVSNNDRKIADIRSQLAVLDKVETYVRSKNSSAGIVPSTLGINDPVLLQLLQKLYNAEIEYQKLSKNTAESNPLLVSVSEEIEKIRPSILENINSQRVNLEASKANLVSINNQFHVTLQSIPQKERELLEISRQQAIKNNAYSFLLQKREEAVLSYAPTVGESRIVDKAESSLVPVSPKPFHLYLMAVVSACAIGYLFIKGQELLNSKILFRSEIEQYTSAPIVSELSFVKRKKAQVFIEPTETAIVEQFRKLRITMGLYGQGNKRKIMITSNIPGEGKSFVSSNLAYILAASGKKVILVDFDLRNPNASLLFDVYKHKGVTDCILGQDTLDKVITETKYSNLSIVPAGIDIGDHTDLILNGKFKAFFDYLEEVFDYVIVDTPPIDLVSDAYVLSNYCDITLLVLRHAYTPKNLVQDYPQNNVIQSLNNVAIVFNGVKPRGFVKGQYGYGYGYGRLSVYDNKAYKSRKIEA